MSTFQIKMVAVVAMLLDHIAYFFPVETSFTLIFHWIGRSSAPLFIFCLVNGIKRTHSKKLYITRLYLASVIMAIFQTVTQVELNFLRTLFITAILLSIIEKQECSCKRDLSKTNHIGVFLYNV